MSSRDSRTPDRDASPSGPESAATGPPADPSPTEATNPRTADLDRLPTDALVARLVQEDAAVHAAVTRALPEIARAVDVLHAALSRGGRWINVGAGTSGRLGLLDAAEIPPTFGAPPEWVQGVLAGGPPALERAVEGAEDSPEAARADLETRGVGERDVVVGLSASGHTPYVLGALEHAREVGAQRLCITCSPDSPLARAADPAIVVEVGPEVIAGSTRLKGGLAQKMVLHTLSTAVFVKLGHTRGNRMSHVRISNRKLRERAIQTLSDLTGCARADAERALELCDGSVPRALEWLEQ